VLTPETRSTTRRAAHGACFEKTSPTLIREAHKGSREAMEELCRRYWYPLYTWLLVTRLGRTEHDAEDFVQGFFEKMLERESLAAHDSTKGRFRTYLLTCLKRYVIDRHRKWTPDLVEPSDDEGDPLSNIEEHERADAAFEKAWAWEILEVAKTRLRGEWQRSGRVELFDAFAPYLEGQRSEDGLEAIGQRNGLSHGNTRIQLHRLKKQLRDVLVTMVDGELPDDATAEERSDEMRRFLEAILL
jgi:RNA polymerase sigma factor (sigma-70 family)